MYYICGSMITLEISVIATISSSLENTNVNHVHVP